MSVTIDEPRIEANGSIGNFKCKGEKLTVTLDLMMTAERVEELARLMTRGQVSIVLVPVQRNFGENANGDRVDRSQGALDFEGAPRLCVCGHLIDEKHTTDDEGVVECFADAVVGEGRCPCKAIEELEGAEDVCGECDGHYRRLHDPKQRLAAHVPLDKRPPSGLPVCYAHGMDNPCMCTGFVLRETPIEDTPAESTPATEGAADAAAAADGAPAAAAASDDDPNAEVTE